MMSIESRIAGNYRDVQHRIDVACQQAGRSSSDVKLVAVTKYAKVEWVQKLIKQGVCDLGESRPQQLLGRAELFPNKVRWHLIGHLQRNKARRILPLVSLIHSVDTFRLLSTLDRLAEELELRPRVLLEVNMSGEPAKHGFSQQELVENWKNVLECRHLQIDGLMTMAALTEDVEETRPVFYGLREFRDSLVDLSPSSVPLIELSMGMSRDFEMAIEEGATILRIGSRLFEGLSRDD
jgi:pyridoxal phosphate enzyme (YggS family)